MYSEFILMAISGGFIIIGAIILRDGGFLLSRGKKAEAVIFKNNDHQDGMSHPVVRFLTDKQEWITQELTDGFNPPIPEGTKIEVLYDPDNPTEVAINSSLRLKLLPRVFIVMGVVGLVFSILEYMGVFGVKLK